MSKHVAPGRDLQFEFIFAIVVGARPVRRNLKDEELENRRDMGLVGDDIEKTIASRYGLGKDELEGNKEALMRRVNYKQHASKASRIFQSGPAWVG